MELKQNYEQRETQANTEVYEIGVAQKKSFFIFSRRVGWVL